MSDAVIAALGLLAATTVAPPRSWSLTWEAPPECPSAPQVRRRIETLLPDTASTQTAPPLEVHVLVSALDSGQWRLHLDSQRGEQQGERELTSESCPALAESAAVIVALLLNPAQLPPPAPARPAPPTLPPSALVRAPLAPPVRERQLLLGFEGSVERGALPGWGSVLNLILGWQGSRGRAEGVMRVHLPERQYAAASNSAGGDFWLLSAEIRLCPMLGAQRVRAGICGQADAGAFHAAAWGVRAPSQVWSPWLAAGAGPQLAVRLGERWALRATAQISLPLLRPRFELEGVGPVHQPGSVSLEAGLGTELYF